MCSFSTDHYLDKISDNESSYQSHLVAEQQPVDYVPVELELLPHVADLAEPLDLAAQQLHHLAVADL